MLSIMKNKKNNQPTPPEPLNQAQLAQMYVDTLQRGLTATRTRVIKGQRVTEPDYGVQIECARKLLKLSRQRKQR